MGAHVADAAACGAMARKLAYAPTIGLDAEWAETPLALLQVATRDTAFLVDVNAMRDGMGAEAEGGGPFRYTAGPMPSDDISS